MKTLACAAFFALSLTLTAFADGGLTQVDPPTLEGEDPEVAGPATLDRGALEPAVRAVELIAPAVVNVAALGKGRSPRSLGSGVIVHAAGLVLTNAHVVKDARDPGTRIVVYRGGRSIEATLLAASPGDDLALLRIDMPEGAKAARLSARSPRIGQTCLAIGNPFGLEHSVSRGIVSARGRRLRVAGRLVSGTFLQTDAAIHPGNSGGPLIDLEGRVIGLTTAIRKGKGGGIGFAIPAKRLRRALISLSDPARLSDRFLGLRVTPTASGVRILALAPGGPAARAGLSVGDVLVALGPRALSSTFDVQVAALLASGRTLRVAFLRRGTRRGTVLHMSRTPATRSIWRRLGVRTRDLDESLAWERKVSPGGIVVTEVAPRSAAGALGLKAGDRLFRYQVEGLPDHRPLSSRQALADLLGELPAGVELRLTIRRAGHDYEGALTLP
ncbi:MAG: trypsin-like peptidase domain-containing protein [Planctomycetes bacterium]|nr:trypsin-like peptidase domain-containing protein [Planctomycetota bacterium]